MVDKQPFYFIIHPLFIQPLRPSCDGPIKASVDGALLLIGASLIGKWMSSWADRYVLSPYSYRELFMPHTMQHSGAWKWDKENRTYAHCLCPRIEPQFHRQGLVVPLCCLAKQKKKGVDTSEPWSTFQASSPASTFTDSLLYASLLVQGFLRKQIQAKCSLVHFCFAALAPHPTTAPWFQNSSCQHKECWAQAFPKAEPNIQPFLSMRSNITPRRVLVTYTQLDVQ